jgi:hypothetical protein
MDDDAPSLIAPLLGAWLALAIIAAVFFGLPYLREAIRSAAETTCPDVCTLED